MAAEEKCIVEENELLRYLRRLMESDVERLLDINHILLLLFRSEI